MATITAVVHTKNSALTLKRCLSSLSWCNQIFVVDMGSEDETKEIAKKYGVTIFEAQTKYLYPDPIRNEYLKKVTTDWTIIVDSDEEVSASLAQKISQAMMTPGVNGYSLPRKNIIFAKWIEHTGFWPDYIIRLFRTGKGVYPAQIHAQPIIEGAVVEIPALEENALIHHHYNTIEDFIRRLNTYTTIEVEKLQDKQRKYKPIDGLIAFFMQFQTRFFDQQGYKDGMYGFTLSLLMGTYSMVAVLKAWEKEKIEEVINLEDVDAAMMNGCIDTSYWVANEELKVEKNIIKKFRLRMRRKANS